MNILYHINCLLTNANYTGIIRLIMKGGEIHMSWQKEYYVSCIETIKTIPVKVKKSNSKDEALENFKKMVNEGDVEQEERTFQYIITENWKKY
jgi:hypothetical protein